MRRWASRILLTKRRRWESNPLETALQAVALPSGSSAVLFSAPPRNRTSSCRFVVCRAIRHTRRASTVSRPGVEPGPGPSEGPMRSVTPSGCSASRPGARTRTWALGEPVQSTTLSGRIFRADGWICTSMMRFTKPPPRCSATSAAKTGPICAQHPPGRSGKLDLSPFCKHEREDSNPVGRLWRPSALPGARSCPSALRPSATEGTLA